MATRAKKAQSKKAKSATESAPARTGSGAVTTLNFNGLTVFSAAIIHGNMNVSLGDGNISSHQVPHGSRMKVTVEIEPAEASTS